MSIQKSPIRTHVEILADLDMFKKAKAIREWVQGISGLIPRLHDNPNSFYGSTSDGLTLIQYYGGPSSIGTPVGKWAMSGGGCLKNDKWLDEAKDRLGLVSVMPETNNEQGCYGPIWAIQRDLDGNELPTTQYKFRGIGVGIVSDHALSHLSKDEILAYSQSLNTQSPEWFKHQGNIWETQFHDGTTDTQIKNEIADKIIWDAWYMKIKPGIEFLDWTDIKRDEVAL